ncbi:hypothetical protein VTO73DRAFT_6612 [Trametes versicolor]
MPPRKKARKGTARAEPPTSGTPPGQAAESTIEGPATTDAGPSNRNPPRRAIRGRRGGLKDMPNMPLDILIEIFSCMHPRDLLNIARTSKAFRAFLMSRSAAPFWKAARKQVGGLPECPSFLSEPQYANLLFFTNCHNCLKPNIQTTVWEIYARYCQPCKDKLILPDVFNGHALLREIKTEVEVDVTEFITVIYVSQTKHVPYHMACFHLPEVLRLQEKWKGCTTDNEKTRCIQEQADTLKERKAPLNALRLWKAAQLDGRAAELEAIRQARVQSILERLRQEGWEDELGRMSRYTLHRLEALKVVRKAQKLTENAWRSIRQEVVDYVEGVRTARLAHERHQLICERLNILHDVITAREDFKGRRTAKSDIQAGFADLALAPQFQALAEAPSTTEITRADFEALQDTIPALAAEWFAERKAELLPKVEAVLKAPDGIDPLSLAIVTFHCASCEREDLRWPNILAHKCVRGSTYIGSPYKRALSTVCAKKGQRFPWRDRKNVFSISPKVAAARSVVAACGLDPDMATHEEIDECEARLVCTACSADPMVQCREALDWWRAVAHKPPAFKMGPKSGCGGKWKVLDAELAARVREREQVITSSLAGFDMHLQITAPLMSCTRCHHRSRTGVVEHCKSQHNVADPQAEEDYYIYPDCRPFMRTVRIYPEKTDPLSSLRISASVAHGAGMYSSAAFE